MCFCVPSCIFVVEILVLGLKSFHVLFSAIIAIIFILQEEFLILGNALICFLAGFLVHSDFLASCLARHPAG